MFSIAKLPSCPTNPFIIFEPRDQNIGDFYVVLERRLTDLEATKF